jgi:hypothetical protein
VPSSADRPNAGPQIVTHRLPAPSGSSLARALLRLAGWGLVFDGLPARQGVFIAYPHTSNCYFVVGVLAKWARGLAFFDDRRKRIGVEVFLRLSGDPAADLRAIAAACDRAAGRHPQLAGPIVFKG